MSEGAGRRGTEPIEERPGTEGDGREGGRNTSATPPIGAKEQAKDQTQTPAEDDDAGVGGAGTQDERP